MINKHIIDVSKAFSAFKISREYMVRNLIADKQNFITTPPYQRGKVWSPKQCQMFIQAIMSGARISPLVFVHKAVDSVDYYVTDGRQRLDCAIYGFVNNEFKVNLQTSRADRPKNLTYTKIKRYAEDPKNPCGICKKFLHKFESAVIVVNVYNPMNLDQQKDLFDMINQSKPLTNDEKLFARNCVLKNFCVMTWNYYVVNHLKSWMRDKWEKDLASAGARQMLNLLYQCFGTAFNDQFAIKDVRTQQVIEKAVTMEAHLKKILDCDEYTEFDDEKLKQIGLLSKLKKIDLASECLSFALKHSRGNKKNVEGGLLMDYLLFYTKCVIDGVFTYSFCQVYAKQLNDVLEKYKKYRDESYDLKGSRHAAEKARLKLAKLESLCVEAGLDMLKKCKPVTLKEKTDALNASNGICPLSGTPLDFNNIEFDHKIPKVLTSTNSIQVVAPEANRVKGAAILT